MGGLEGLSFPPDAKGQQNCHESKMTYKKPDEEKNYDELHDMCKFYNRCCKFFCLYQTCVHCFYRRKDVLLTASQVVHFYLV